MTHVCYLSHTADNREGGERSLLEVIRYFQARDGFRVTLIAPPGPLAEEASQWPAVRYVPIPFTLLRRTANPLRMAGFGLSYIGSVVRLNRTLAQLRPDLLHCNSATSALYGAGVSVGVGTPLVWHMRDIQPPRATFRAVLPLIGRRVTRIAAISEAVRENLLAFGIDSSKITVIHNAVVPPEASGGDIFRARHGLGQEPLIGIVGKLISRKGQLHAVRALPRIREAIPDARLVLCGGNEESPYGRELRREVDRLGLTKAVVFAGYQRRIGEVFDAMDLVMVPSEQEPFGRVVVEAMFARRPIVASRVGGIPELIRDGMDGALVDPGDVNSLAAAAVAILTDPERERSVVESAANRAEAEFTWGSTGAKMAVLYEDVMSEASSTK